MKKEMTNSVQVFEGEVRKRLTSEQNEWWDSDAATGSWYAGWTVEETLIVIKEAWEEFCKIDGEKT